MIFKRCLFFVALLFLPIMVFGEVACDFDGDDIASEKDLVILIGWLQMRYAEVPESQMTVENLLAVAVDISKTVTKVSRMPTFEKDNLTDESPDVINDQDVAFFIAYKQVEYAGVKNIQFDTVKEVAIDILKTLRSSMGRAPGTPVGNSYVPITITNIQVDPSN